jgi:hypothetical protein
MKTGKKVSISIIFWLVLSALILNCGNNDLISNPSNGSEQISPAAEFFPLNENYFTTYEISGSNGSSELQTFKVGDEVPFNGSTAIEWFSYESNRTDTGFFQVTDEAIIYYPSRNSASETIVQLPFAVGASWDRSDDIIINDSSSVDSVDINGTKFDTTTTIIITGKQLPIDGSSSMLIEAKESIVLDDGTHYTGAYRIQTTSTQTTSNYYWYVSDVGLVKYILDAENGTYETGREVGELVDYGTRSF